MAQAARKVTAKDANAKLAHRRLTVLELAERLGNVAEAWVETMDRRLPFGFLDHKLRCGNSLIGCWFDRFQDYPVMAFERDDAGDKNHERFVHHYREYRGRGKDKGQWKRKGDLWTQRWKEVRENVIKPEARARIAARREDVFPFMRDGYSPERIHDEALETLRALHDLPVHEVDRREQLYRDEIAGNPAFARLREAFDTWCAIWFWPGDKLDLLPTPKNFQDPPEATRAIVARLRDDYRFFHWELEFPDVFTRPGSGFDAIVGNPPWEIQKPNSKEFFSNIDPLYRVYGKQEALRCQKEYFARSEATEHEWLTYCARFKSLSTWNKFAAFPFGDTSEGESRFALARSTRDNTSLHEAWRRERSSRRSYADAEHPFRHQGSADINTYKMFCEAALACLRDGGFLGLITPSGIYADRGSTELRKLLLGRCRWEWLFGFENRQGIFDIHRSFKFNPIIVRKGGRTSAIRTAFMHRSVEDWQEAERHVLPYPRERVEQFSPTSSKILEIRSERDLQVLERIYRNSVLLAGEEPDGWGIRYTREFDMTNDSKLFPPKPWWEERGYQPNEYGIWTGPSSDVALPVYNAKMFDLFDFSSRAWIRGKGRGAEWTDIGYPKQLGPEYLMSARVFLENGKLTEPGLARLLFKDISTAIHYRTMLCSIVPELPSVNAAPILATTDTIDLLTLQALLGSLCLDYVARLRIGYLHLNYFVIEELPLPPRGALPPTARRFLSFSALRLCGTHELFAPLWRASGLGERLRAWRSQWAVTQRERLRLRCILDALAAELYGLEYDDLAWLLGDCGHPAQALRTEEFTAVLNPKGFWRVNKDRDPELRHPVLTLVAFHDLKRLGLEAFLTLNDGEGWMVPETLRLADYGVAHDDRAKEPQPVASRLGDRFLPWQLGQSPEESWEECERHARRIEALLGRRSSRDDAGESRHALRTSVPTDLFGRPLPTDLFGNIVAPRSNGQRR